MKNLSTLAALSFAFTVVPLSVATADDMAPYPFSNTEGKSVMAMFESQDATSATVRMENGRQLKLPKDKLSKATLKFLEGIASAGETKENTGREDAPLLPTFSSGPYKGSFAVYEHEKFTAKVTRTGSISISLKDDQGKGVPYATLTLTPVPGEYSKEGFRPKHTESTFSKQKPSMQPTVVELTGECRGGNPEWEASYTFSGNQILCYGDAEFKKAARGIKGAFEMAFASPVIDRQDKLSPEKEAEIAGDALLTVRRPDKSTLEFPFMAEKYTFSNDEKLADGTSEAAMVSGKLFGPRKVIIGSNRPEYYSLHFENRIMSRLSEGFKVKVRIESGKSGSDRAAVVLTID